MPPITSRPPYQKRPVPQTTGDLLRWLPVEFGNIARAIPPSRARIIVQDDTPNNQDDLVVCDATASSIVVHLPLANQTSGLRLTFIRVDTSGHTVTLSATISGAVNPTLASQYSCSTVQSDGIRWLLLSQIP